MTSALPCYNLNCERSICVFWPLDARLTQTYSRNMTGQGAEEGGGADGDACEGEGHNTFTPLCT
eukprot:26771-Eustigmatos_ZCMA.PRE.1